VYEAVHLSDYALGVDDAMARVLGHEAMRYDARLPGPGNWMVGLNGVVSYHSPDCVDGGALDVHPDSSDWPN